MSLFTRISSLWQRLTHRNELEAELHDELRSYLDELSEEKILHGMTAGDARRAAQIEIGGMEQLKETCRDGWSLRWLDSAAADVRYGFRSLSRTPVFAFTVVATIGLGLGLNTTLFTLFDAYVLRPLSIPDPYSLYEFTWTNRAGIGHVFTWPEAQALRGQKQIFTDVLVAQQLLTRVEGNQLFGQFVSGKLFHDAGAWR